MFTQRDSDPMISGIRRAAMALFSAALQLFLVTVIVIITAMIVALLILLFVRIFFPTSQGRSPVYLSFDPIWPVLGVTAPLLGFFAARWFPRLPGTPLTSLIASLWFTSAFVARMNEWHSTRLEFRT